VRNRLDDFPPPGIFGAAGSCEGGCEGIWLLLGVKMRLGAEAVRVAEGFSTMRIGSRSAESAAKRVGLVESGELPSAETERRGGAVDAGGGGSLAVLLVDGLLVGG
jgi:hypothetical protein